jgi:hypothetical protein
MVKLQHWRKKTILNNEDSIIYTHGKINYIYNRLLSTDKFNSRLILYENVKDKPVRTM